MEDGGKEPCSFASGAQHKFGRMACFTFAPMRAALPRVSVSTARPQQKLSVPAFSGLRLARDIPAQPAGVANSGNVRLDGPAAHLTTHGLVCCKRIPAAEPPDCLP